jgi:hypothetical protein
MKSKLKLSRLLIWNSHSETVSKEKHKHKFKKFVFSNGKASFILTSSFSFIPQFMKILPFVTQLIIGLDRKIIAGKICFIVEILFISFYPLVFSLLNSVGPVLRGRFPSESHKEHSFKIKMEWKITKKLNK